MKRIMLSLGLSFSLATCAFAADNPVEQLNTQVANILAPLQNNTTVAKIKFDAFESDEERATKVAVKALYRKTGPSNTLALKITNLSYDYGDGSAPTTVIKGGIGINLSKLFTTEELNFLMEDATEVVKNLAADYMDDYGNALSIKSVITSTTKDANGNYTGLTGLISAKIDLSKLTDEDLDVEDIKVTEVVLSLELDVKHGLKINAYIVSNPAYVGFKQGEEGLKELLQNLIDGDEEQIEAFQVLAQQLDALVTELVSDNYKPSLKMK